MRPWRATATLKAPWRVSRETTTCLASPRPPAGLSVPVWPRRGPASSDRGVAIPNRLVGAGTIASRKPSGSSSPSTHTGRRGALRRASPRRPPGADPRVARTSPQSTHGSMPWTFAGPARRRRSRSSPNRRAAQPQRPPAPAGAPGQPRRMQWERAATASPRPPPPRPGREGEPPATAGVSGAGPPPRAAPERRRGCRSAPTAATPPHPAERGGSDGGVPACAPARVQPSSCVGRSACATERAAGVQAAGRGRRWPSSAGGEIEGAARGAARGASPPPAEAEPGSEADPSGSPRPRSCRHDARGGATRNGWRSTATGDGDRPRRRSGAHTTRGFT
jgi:hypothetical protein